MRALCGWVPPVRPCLRVCVLCVCMTGLVCVVCFVCFVPVVSFLRGFPGVFEILAARRPRILFVLLNATRPFEPR